MGVIQQRGTVYSIQHTVDILINGVARLDANIFHRGAVGKWVVAADVGHAGRDCDLRQAAAAKEGRSINERDMAAQCDFSKTGAGEEQIGGDSSDAVGEGDLRQAVTVIKCPATDGGDAGGRGFAGGGAQ